MLKEVIHVEIDYNLFNNQINSLLHNPSDETLSKFEKAYDLYKRLNYSPVNSESIDISNELLSFLFETASGSYCIPMSFIESPVGIVLFSLKFGVPEQYFTTSDVEIIAQISRSLISIDLSHKKITVFKPGRNILITRSSLINYMETKGISRLESTERINTFLELKSLKVSKQEISLAIKKIKPKYSR